ncbi:MAG: hypothetical protein JJU28_07665 [Cyclobacteriaceae bacterium]|nr:hypothetical protein [Cyclobacteriaceae bacterium]
MEFAKFNPVILTLIISFSFSVNSFCQNDLNDKTNPTDTPLIKAQDYNSSRSNKARGEAAPNDIINNPNPTDSLLVKPIRGDGSGTDVSSLWDTFHILNTLYLGGGINTFRENVEGRDFTNSDFGINLGFYKPILKKQKYSLGLLTSGAYSFANNNFGSIENPISYIDATAVSTSSQGRQSLLQFGIGPQMNIPIHKQLLLSPSVQGGYFFFNQDAISLNQEISPKNTEPLTKEVFWQEKVDEGGFFVKPAVKMSYAISKNWSLWAEGSYLLANTTTIQNTLIPNGSPREGEFFWDQIMSAKSFKESNKEISLNSVGVNFGLAIRLGRDQNYSGTGHVDVFRGRNPQIGGRGSSSNMKKKTSENLPPSNEFRGIRSRSGIIIDFEDDAIKDPNPTDTLQVKAQDYNSSRSNKARGEASPNDNIDNPKPTDSLQVKANKSAGSHTNPYLVSNELAGDMPGLANNSTSGTNSSFDASKIKEVKREKDLRGREVVLYRDGKQYYYDASKKKVRAILKYIENDNIEKATGCPPAGMEGTNCTPKNGFYWCYLGRDKEKK